MQRLKNCLLASFLLSGVFVSCRQDVSEPNSATTVGRDSVMLRFAAEVSVEDDQARALDYKLGKNAKGQLVPMPQFREGQEVEVHTIIKNNLEPSTVVAKTLKWRYDAKKKKLVLKQDDGHSIEVLGFNNDGGTKWYVSGLIGGALIPGTTRVTFSGERVLKGVSGNENDIVGSLNVPYAFGWTELSIDTQRPGNTRDVSTHSYKYGAVPSTANVKFRPLGSLIAYKLGNAQTSGSYEFSPDAFTVASNAWGDQGEFQLNTDIPATKPERSLPTWKEEACGASMYYTFVPTPSTIAHNAMSDKTYYAWAMPHKVQPEKAEVRVMLKGRSSSASWDYTKTYFTDYAPKSTGTQGFITSGKVHNLSARATHRVVLPIEHVMEYNLAGGEGFTYKASSSPQPDGVTGNFRFAASQNNDQSGYYNWYKVVGRYHATYNPNRLNLQNDLKNMEWFIPTLDQWWGVYPSNRNFTWTGGGGMDFTEIMASFSGSKLLRASYLSDYSAAGERPNDSYTTDAVVYAVRFKERRRNCNPVEQSLYYYDPDTDVISSKSHTYPYAMDNSLKCAYRFTLAGGTASWADAYLGSSNFTNHLVIDVAYLGDELNPTDLSTISNEEWWREKKRARLVVTKVFPATAYIYAETLQVAHRGSWGAYWSVNAHPNSDTQGAMVDVYDTHVRGQVGWFAKDGLAVRLFQNIRH